MTFNALASSPDADPAQVLDGLRDQLRRTAARVAAGTPDWSTLVLQEPVEVADERGRTRYLWLATVETSLC